jgi:TIR domain
MEEEAIRIESRVYRPTGHGEFEIPLSELGAFTFTGVPFYSTLTVKPLPVVEGFFRMEVSATHAGGRHNEDFSLSVKIFFSVQGEPESPTANARCFRIKRYVRRIFQPIAEPAGFTSGADFAPFFYTEGKLLCIEAFYRQFSREDDPVLAEYINPFVTRYQERLASFRDTLLFLCHASEDKSFVDELCSFLDSCAVPIWYDRREIRVGDSIVQRISDGIDEASHLIIVLSKASVVKPWVRKEFSSALARQLQDSSVRVLPLLVEECEIPPLLADIRYADCRRDRAQAFRELMAAIT